MADRGIEVFLRFVLDRQTVQQVKSGALSVDKALKQVQAQTEKTQKQMDQVRNWAGYFGDLSTSALFFGAAVSGPLLLSIHQFVGATGQADAVSRDWLSSTDELQRSYQRIGRVSAQAVLPALEFAADVAEKLAGYAEDHPGAIQALLYGGGALVGLAAVGEAVERGVRLYADAVSLATTTKAAATQLLAGKLMDQAASKQAGAATGMQKGGLLGGVGGLPGGKALALAGAIGGGIFAGNEIANAVTGDPEYAGRTWRQMAALPGAAAISALLPLFESIGVISPETAKSLGSSFGEIYGAFGNQGVAAGLTELGQFLGLAGEAGDKAEEANESAKEMFLNQAQALKGFIAFQAAGQQAEAQYQEQRSAIISEAEAERERLTQQSEERRTRMVESFASQQAEALAEFERGRKRAERDFERSEVKALADFSEERGRFLEEWRDSEADAESEYYTRRMERAAQFDKETERAEAKHQKNARRAQQDHWLRLEDAIRTQDAGAFIREQRDYEIQRRRREEDFGEQQEPRRGDYTEEVKGLEEQFAGQRELRQADREQQLEEMQAQFDDERQEQLDAFELRRQDEDEDFALQREKAAARNEAALAEFDDQARRELEALEQKKLEQVSALDGQYSEEKQIRQKAFADQLRDLDGAYFNETEKKKEYYALMEKDFMKWLEAMRGQVGSNLPGYSGPLRQSPDVASSSRSSVSNSRSLSYAPTYNISERDDTRAIRAMIERGVDQAILRDERGY
jgi:hypothetical protein